MYDKYLIIYSYSEFTGVFFFKCSLISILDLKDDGNYQSYKIE